MGSARAHPRRDAQPGRIASRGLLLEAQSSMTRARERELEPATSDA